MRSARLLLTALSLGSSLLSFLGYTALLQQLGASAQVDALFYAASIPTGVSALVTAVLVYLLPTRLTELPQDTQEAALRHLAHWMGLATMLALVALLLLAWGLAMRFDPVLSGGFVLHAGLSSVGSLLVCRAQAAGRYVLSGLNQFVLVLGLVAGVGLAIATRDAAWVMPGQLIGSLCAVVIMARQLGLQGLLAPRWTADRAALDTLLAPLKPHLPHILVASTAFTLFQPIDAQLCKQLGDGAVSTMAFAQRAWVAAGVLISLGAHAIAARTSRDAFEAGGAPVLKAVARREVIRILAAGALVWVGYQLAGRALLAALFHAGSMPAAELQRLLDCISWMLLSAPSMAAIPYLFRVQYTLNDYRWPAYIGGAVPVVYGTVAWALSARLGIAALPLALGIAWWLALGGTLFALHRREGAAMAAPQPRNVQP